jgi:GPH family glycoside/pentoside/hexuronide:cation symporter
VNTLNLHAFRYFWKLPESAMQLPLLVLPIGMLLGTAGSALLMRRIEKRDGVILAVIVLSVYLTGLTIAGVMGWVPPGSTLATALVVGNGLLFGICGALCFVCFYSMIADAVDEHDHLFGVRREALYAAALMLGAKAATGIGSFLAGAGLELVGFPSSNGAIVSIPAHTATGLVLLWGPGSALLFLAALPLFRRYRIDRARHAEVLTHLTERRVKAEAEAGHAASPLAHATPAGAHP